MFVLIIQHACSALLCMLASYVSHSAVLCVHDSVLFCPDLWQSTFSEDHSAHSSVAQL